jgi:hypothetical protein
VTDSRSGDAAFLVGPAKIVSPSLMGELFTPADWDMHMSTKHALESIA